MMRVVLNIKRSDRISTEKLLKKCKMLSINQILCKTILLEVWKAFKFNVTSISGAFKKRENKRFNNLLQCSLDPKSIISVASKLWEKTSDRFKETNLITVAKKEAQSLAKKLPF